MITDGHASVDESMLTGESMPVGKSVGENVFCGYSSYRRVSAFLKLKKSVRIRCCRRSLQMVEAAQGSKAPIAKTADKIAAVFVPVSAGDSFSRRLELVVCRLWQ